MTEKKARRPLITHNLETGGILIRADALKVMLSLYVVAGIAFVALMLLLGAH